MNDDFSCVTQAFVAAIHGVDVRTVRRWTALGLPRNRSGSYDAAATIRWRARWADAWGYVDAELLRRRAA